MTNKSTGNIEEDKRLLSGQQKEQLSLFLTDSLPDWLWVASLTTLTYQVYLWLEQGRWVALPLFDLLDKIPEFRSWVWIHHPESWQGLHDIVTFFLDFGLSALFALLAVASLWMGIRVRKSQE